MELAGAYILLAVITGIFMSLLINLGAADAGEGGWGGWGGVLGMMTVLTVMAPAIGHDDGGM
jgi:hypothetical protein